MKPRLKGSTKWTALPEELVTNIKDIFNQNFKKAAKTGEFRAEGRIFSSELLLRVGHLEKGRIGQANFEVSIEFDPKKQNALKLIHTAVDCAGALMQQYLEGVDLKEFPVQWTQYEVEGRKVYVQASPVNSELEAKADQLLGVGDDGLVGGADEQEELDALKATLGLDDEDS